MELHILKNDRKDYLLGVVVVTSAPYLADSFRRVGFTVKEHCHMWHRLDCEHADHPTFTAMLRCYTDDAAKAQRLVQELADRAHSASSYRGWEEVL